MGGGRTTTRAPRLLRPTNRQPLPCYLGCCLVVYEATRVAVEVVLAGGQGHELKHLAELHRVGIRLKLKNKQQHVRETDPSEALTSEYLLEKYNFGRRFPIFGEFSIAEPRRFPIFFARSALGPSVL